MDQIAVPSVKLPMIIHLIATAPLFSRMRCAWVSAVNEPTMATSTDKMTSDMFQEMSTIAELRVYAGVILTQFNQPTFGIVSTFR
jgi:hypothetical protein